MRLVFISALIVLMSCKPPARKTVFVDPALEMMVPADSTFVAGADLDAIRMTHIFQKYLGKIPLPQLDDFTKKTGIDPRRNLWQVLTSSNGKTGLFMARGRFTHNDEEPRVEIPGVQRIGYKGYTMFGDERRAVIFTNTSTAAAGLTSDLRTMVDLRNEAHHGFPEGIKQKVDGISHDNQIWAAFTGGLSNLNLGMREDSNAGQVLKVMRGISAGTMAANLRDGFSFEAHLECLTTNDAKHVRDAIKGAVGLGRLSTPDNQTELLKLYDAVEVKLDQTRVDVSAKVSDDLADKFLDLWFGFRSN